MVDNSSIRHIHKDIIGRALFYSSIYRRFLNENGFVLAYHSISEEDSNLTCTPSDFRHQCKFLAKYFDVVDIRELLDLIETNSSLDGKAAITFDDGYKDNSDLAADILVNHNLPATFFVATKFIESDHQTWWDKRDGIASQWMTWDDVRALSNAGFTIGGHTQNHVDLGAVNADVAKTEINGCRDDLRRELELNCDVFAFPYGAQNNICDTNLDIVKRAGFASCFSCHGGIVRPGDSVFELARFPISSWHLSEYHLGAQLLRDLIAR